MTENGTVAPGWFDDPSRRFEKRYWDGGAWTEHAWSKGQQTIDPLQQFDASIQRSGARESAVRLEDNSAEPTSKPVDSAGRDTASHAADDIVDAASSEKIPVLGARKHAQRLQAEVHSLKAVIGKYGLLRAAELEQQVDARRRELSDITRRVAEANAELAARHDDVAAARADLVDLRDVAGIQEFGLYDFAHPAEDSVALATQLEALRAEIKAAVRDGQATSATQNFTFNNSSAKGAKFVRDMSKLMLRSYNAEAENCVKSVKAGNLASAQARLSKAVDQIERLGTMIALRITPRFHALRLQELELANRYLQAVQAEKEADRARREELREQRKAEQELAQERSRLEKERAHYANTLAALEANGDTEGAERMRLMLADVDHAIENVDYRAANIRAGYVYVISNVGSFGHDVVKIGLTRRLEPMDRVHELGDASVPFRFDVHALFFAEDAVGIETMLHQHFDSRRINRINTRREYFRATPSEVRDALASHSVEILDFKLEPEAPEFRATQLLSEPSSP